MNFQPREIGHGEHLREQRANVLEVRENALGTVVTFAAQNFVAVASEPVKKILLLLTFLNDTGGCAQAGKVLTVHRNPVSIRP